MSHAQCPPSKRGHSWRELNYDELRMSSLGSVAALKIVHVVRVCKRCGAPGRVDSQGVIHAMELP